MYTSLFKKDDVRKEIWVKIPDFEYEVSNMGNIKSLPKKTVQIYKTGTRALRETKERILRKRFDTNGYSTCALYKNGKTYYKKVHRLVAQAFLENPHSYEQVNHKNGIKSDNRVENLEWCNNSYNQRHAIKLGLRKNHSRGVDNNLHKLSEQDVRRIKMAKSLGIKTSELVKIFKVNRHTVSNIFYEKSWKHIKLNIIANG
jgi:hypothetical protein